MSNIITDAYYSLGRNINKIKGGDKGDTEQGIVSDKIPELTLNMSNADLLSVTNKYEKEWKESPVYSEWITKGDNNEDYWEGKHFSRPEMEKSRPQMDNVIFESLETWIPQTIKKNPDPEVETYPGMPVGPQELQFATDLQNELGSLGEELRMRMKLKRVAKHWAIYLLGVGKIGWDTNRNIPTIKIVRPRKMILDPNATIDEEGYNGDRLGEYRELTAGEILDVPGLESEAEKTIKDMVKDNLATKIKFIEWWTPKYFCWTLNGQSVLLKRQNPHWNYDEEIPVPAIDNVESGPSAQPIEGQPAIPALPARAPEGEAPAEGEMPEAENAESAAPTQTKKGVNHFSSPKMPYIFLSMFNLGDKPVDSTSLIGQNLANQDLINKRLRQIDKNADNMNGGLVVSLERTGLTKEQSKGVSEALRKGGVVAVPAGDPRAAVYRPETPGLPNDIYTQLQDTRSRLRGIFGVQGSSQAGLEPDKTVRGKIMNRTLDTDRMGGGITEYLEQFADDAYDWFVQIKYVYEDKYAAIAEQGVLPKVRVSIKEGSLLPKDATTLANQAVELAGAGQMSKLDLYKALQYPNPEEMAVNAWLEINAPDILYRGDPRVAEAVQRQQQAAQAEAQAKAQGAQKGPSESISFKDLPPDGKVQLAAKAGIVLHPEGIAAHDALQKEPPPGSNAELDKGVAPSIQ